MENGIQHGAATENGLKSPPVDVHIQKCAGDTVIRNGDGPSLEAPNSRRTGRREAREARRSGAAGHHRSHDLNSNSIAEGDDLSAVPKQSEASVCGVRGSGTERQDIQDDGTGSGGEDEGSEDSNGRDSNAEGGTGSDGRARVWAEG